MTIHLYHCARARSLRALWMLEELGLEYVLELMPFPPAASRPGFLQHNPLGTVPVLIDGAVRITESAAICAYLATRGGPSPMAALPGDADYGEWLEWIHYGESTLTYPLAVALRFGERAPLEQRFPVVVEDRVHKFVSRLQPLEHCLARRPWLLARGFSAADVSVGYACFLADMMGLGDRLTPAVHAWWQRAQQREAWQRALAKGHAAEAPHAA